VKALLLDLDDTLLDYSGGVDESWAEACRAGCGPRGYDATRLIAAVAASRRWFWDDATRHRTERVNMTGAWTKIVAHAMTRIDLADPELAATIVEDFAGRRRQRMRLFPDALECLERFRRAGIGLALVTNGDARQQREKIERWELAKHFDAMVIEGEFGAGKPDAAVYRHVLDKLAVVPGEACMVGDNLEFDVDGAQRVGVRGLWLDREGRGLPAATGIRPWRIIRSLAEIGSPGAP
jgi:putative hydrolase of the HAD superfamily